MKLLPLIILLFIVIGCTQQTITPTTPSPGQEPLQQVLPPSAPATKEAAQAEPNVKIDPEVSKLFANSGNVKSYSFDIAFLPDGRAPYSYIVKGSKAKVVLHDPLVFADGIADVVYVDFNQKSAFAYCTKEGIKCTDTKKARPVSFADYEIVLPTAWLDKLRYGTKGRSLTFYDTPVNVVSYEAEGKSYEAYVHNYWGVPVRVAIMDVKTGGGKISGGYEYRTMAFNNVKDADVTP